MKTSDLVGAQLDWAVAQCVGGDMFFYTEAGQPYTVNGNREWFKPSTDWSQGGPIIEREGISVKPYVTDGAGWFASLGKGFYAGPTPLIAAMRCYVAYKLGDEVDMGRSSEFAIRAMKESE